MTIEFTTKQGQYLAFIYYYTKLNGEPPAHMDFIRYFQVTPPTVNDMLKRLESKGLIERQPRTARAIELLVDVEELPELE